MAPVLAPVSRLWGNATLVDSDPIDEMVRDVLYVPFEPDRYYDEDPRWGVYGRDGHLVEGAAYHRGPAPCLIGQSPHRDVSAIPYGTCDEDLIYAGPMILHYGHFLLSSLSRLWWLLRNPDRPGRILFHSHETPEEWFQLDYVRTILGAAGLSPADFAYFDRPTLVRRLWVPRPCLEEMTFVHEAFGEFGNAVGHAIGAPAQTRDGSVVYLSKTRLALGVTRLADEHILERVMAEAGLQIAHPQELSFAEQVKLFTRARKIVGTVGSALHTTMFVERPPEILGLCMKDFVNTNYTMVDAVKRSSALYLHARQHVEAIAGQDFLNTWLFEDMEAVAREMVLFV